MLSLLGAVTGITLSAEEKQIDFTGQGTVLIQSSEFELGGRALAHVLSQLPTLNHHELLSLGAEVTQVINRQKQ
jgi:hypothetical protein